MGEVTHTPAFPPAIAITPSGDVYHGYDGMSLRDWFATHAPPPPLLWWGHGNPSCAGYAQWGYQYADAMLAERAKATGAT